jgi:hypothetical protein
MEKHLSRKEIIKFAHKEPLVLNNHMKTCDDCQRLVYLVKEYYVIGNKILPDAPESLINKVKSLIKTLGIKERSSIHLARLTFDSWSMPQPIGVRDESSMNSRRIRFEAEEIILDIRAEQQKEGWAFVAQINDDSPSASENILKVGKKKLHVDPDGLFQWTSKTPPKIISIQTAVKVIKLPEISWKRSK